MQVLKQAPPSGTQGKSGNKCTTFNKENFEYHYLQAVNAQPEWV